MQACEIFCPPGAIDFNQKDEILTLEVGNIILATGYDPFDARKIPQYGYGRLSNVFTSVEFERMVNAAGPTAGKIVSEFQPAEERCHHPLRWVAG
jgi:heterodisulfide reductase subunit A